MTYNVRNEDHLAGAGTMYMYGYTVLSEKITSSKVLVKSGFTVHVLVIQNYRNHESAKIRIANMSEKSLYKNLQK